MVNGGWTVRSDTGRRSRRSSLVTVTRGREVKRGAAASSGVQRKERCLVGQQLGL